MFCTFFFLNFEFWPESADSAPVWCVSADTDRFNANQPDSAQIDPSQCVSGTQKKKKKDMAPTRRQRHRLPHPASDTGSVAILQHRCIIGADSDEISFI